MQELLSIISGILFVISYSFYIRAIFKKETKPQKATWIIWAATDLIILTTLFLQKVPNYHLALASTTGSVFIAILSFKYGTSGWTKTNIFCLIASIIGITLWQIFNNPLIALVILCLTQIIASIPTIIHSWNKPKEENHISWTIAFLGGALSLLGVSVWRLENFAFPLSATLISSSVLIILFILKKS